MGDAVNFSFSGPVAVSRLQSVPPGMNTVRYLGRWGAQVLLGHYPPHVQENGCSCHRLGGEIKVWGVVCTFFLGYTGVNPGTYNVVILIDNTNGVRAHLRAQA